MLTPFQLPIAPHQEASYAAALSALSRAGIEFLVGGGFGLCLYLPLRRSTKDLDVFLRPSSVAPALAALAADGFAVELTDAAWLAKARRDPAQIDLIFCSYNGLLRVDDSWFEFAPDAELLGERVRVVAPEEMILSKSFVAARDRFDGADVAWLIRNHGERLDWERIERSMHGHWQVLLWQIQHCMYVFPSTRSIVPPELVRRLLGRFTRDLSDAEVASESCRGPMLDPLQYLPAIGEGATDPRPRVDLVEEYGLST